MHSRELKQQMIAGTLPRIMDIAMAIYLRANLELNDTPPDEQVLPEIKKVWSPMLSTFAFRLVRAAAALATDGIFIASDQNIAAAVAGVELEKLANGTGVDRKDVLFVLEKTAESLVVIIREHGTIDIEIDQQPFRLCI